MKICAFLTMLTLISIASAIDSRCFSPSHPYKTDLPGSIEAYTFVSGECKPYTASKWDFSENQFINELDCESNCFHLMYKSYKVIRHDPKGDGRTYTLKQISNHIQQRAKKLKKSKKVSVSGNH